MPAPHEDIRRDLARLLREDADNLNLVLIGEGRQSRVWAINGQGFGAAVAIKEFKQHSLLQNPAAAESEYEKLEQLYDCLGTDEHTAVGSRVTSPAPVAGFRWGYVMSRVEGVPLARHEWHDMRRGLAWADALIQALSEYHRKSNSVFGDFHDNNVLVGTDGAGLILLDPGAANVSWYARLEPREWLAADVGYWIFTTCCAREPAPRAARAARMRMAAVLLDRATRHTVDVPRLVNQHLADLAALGPRETVVAAYGHLRFRRLARVRGC